MKSNSHTNGEHAGPGTSEQNGFDINTGKYQLSIRGENPPRYLLICKKTRESMSMTQKEVDSMFEEYYLENF